MDEYQDTNAVQNVIFDALSAGDNLFMVGDVKQSIYRFRLADPTIFLDKYARYADYRVAEEGEGRTVLLLSLIHIFNGIGDQIALVVVAVVLEGQQFKGSLGVIKVDGVGQPLPVAVGLVMVNALASMDGVIGHLQVHVLRGVGDDGTAAGGLGRIVLHRRVGGVLLPTIE